MSTCNIQESGGIAGSEERCLRLKQDMSIDKSGQGKGSCWNLIWTSVAQNVHFEMLNQGRTYIVNDKFPGRVVEQRS